MKRWIAQLKGGGKREILAPDENEAIKQLRAEKSLIISIKELEHTPKKITSVDGSIYSEDALYDAYKKIGENKSFADFIINLVIKGGFKIA